MRPPAPASVIGALALAACGGHKEPAATAAASAPSAPPPAIREAFAAVYPQPRVTAKLDGTITHLQFSPVAVYRVDATTFALVSAGKNLDADCHACAGAISVAYLARRPALTPVAAPVLFASGGWGEPAQVALAPGFGAAPLLRVDEASSDQGDETKAVHLIRLGAAGDVREVGDIKLSFDDTNSGFGANCRIDGELRPGQPDTNFSVEYSGAIQKTVQYRWLDGAWRADGGFDPEAFCAARANPIPPPADAAAMPVSAGMGPAEVDRLTSDAVLLGRAIGCHLDVEAQSRRVGAWLDRVAPPGSRDQQVYLPMLMAGMRENAQAQSSGRSPDTCDEVAAAVQGHDWP